MNPQFRGELAGQASQMGTDSVWIGGAMSTALLAAAELTSSEAPKVNTYNQQVRGELAGKGSDLGTDSIAIGGAMSMYLSLLYSCLTLSHSGPKSWSGKPTSTGRTSWTACQCWR